MAADRLRRLPLRGAPVQAHPTEVLAQGLRVLGIARRSRFPSSKQDTTTYAYTPRGALLQGRRGERMSAKVQEGR
jgi:hypothetical protein